MISLTLASNQKREGLTDMYIKFDPSRDSMQASDNVTIFILADHGKLPINSRHQLNNFQYDKTMNKFYTTDYSIIACKLKSGIEAIKIVDYHLKKNAGRFMTPMYYNSYFKHVYMVVPTETNTANVYEVDWRWVQ